MNAGEKKWYVLYTMPQHEKKLAELLGRKGIEFYLPLVPKKRRWSDRYKIVEFPLFPGYLFARLDWATEHTLILKQPGALSFIRGESGPSVMADEDLRNLRLIIDQAQELTNAADKEFPPGQEVAIRFGPLKGVRGVVARVRGNSRLFVRVPLLGRMVSTEIDAMDVEKIS